MVKNKRNKPLNPNLPLCDAFTLSLTPLANTTSQKHLLIMFCHQKNLKTIKLGEYKKKISTYVTFS